ncbi:hypothetical protein A5N15_05290 [Rothia kristinae]|uniref:Uncharacterized protein n=1 Tax=Rothia kristinae TaxID=37923 RepID=A0A657IV02_9MICC|nr:hypothetical protein A5N15_05290 [Rothia kristinae]
MDMDRIEEATRSLDPTDPESMRTILSGDLFTPQLTEDQEVTLRRLETLLALVEGLGGRRLRTAPATCLPHPR